MNTYLHAHACRYCGSSRTWVASGHSDHCVDEAVLQEEVVGDVGPGGVVALAADDPLRARVSHLHLAEPDERHRVKLGRELLGAFIWERVIASRPVGF